jgi:hypothetical protein
VAEGDADSRAGVSDFWHAVLPLPLRASSRHEKIASAQSEGPRPTTALWPEQKLAGLAQRNESNDRVDDLFADPVPVPRNTVLPIAIEVETSRIK